MGVLTNTAVSGQHVEMKPIAGKRAVSIKDLSTNGIGFRTSKTGPLTRLDKGADVPIKETHFFLSLPYKVKAKDEATAESMRLMIEVKINTDGQEPVEEPEEGKEARPEQSSDAEKEEKEEKEKEKEKDDGDKRKKDKEGDEKKKKD